MASGIYDRFKANLFNGVVLALQASNAKLVEALKRYGDHEPCCIKGDACNCGFEQALKEAEEL